MGGFDDLLVDHKALGAEVLGLAPVSGASVQFQIVEEHDGSLGHVVAADRAVLGGDVRHDGRRRHPQSLEDRRLRERHRGAVKKIHIATIAAHSADLCLDLCTHLTFNTFNFGLVVLNIKQIFIIVLDIIIRGYFLNSITTSILKRNQSKKYFIADDEIETNC